MRETLAVFRLDLARIVATVLSLSRSFRTSARLRGVTTRPRLPVSPMVRFTTSFHLAAPPRRLTARAYAARFTFMVVRVGAGFAVSPRRFRRCAATEDRSTDSTRSTHKGLVPIRQFWNHEHIITGLNMMIPYVVYQCVNILVKI